MYTYNKRLGTHALMTPHLMVWTCRNCKDIPTNCAKIDEIVFCVPPIPDSPLSGSEILNMGVEELCIYDIYKDNKNADTWWIYLMDIYNCKDHNFSQSCASHYKRQSKINIKALEACKSKRGVMLFDEYLMWQTVGVPYTPAVVINNRVYRVVLYVKCREA